MLTAMKTARNLGTFMLNVINGPKRLQNHVHVHASKTKESMLYDVKSGKIELNQFLRKQMKNL
jgi:hypothetical protein